MRLILLYSLIYTTSLMGLVVTNTTTSNWSKADYDSCGTNLSQAQNASPPTTFNYSSTDIYCQQNNVTLEIPDKDKYLFNIYTRDKLAVALDDCVFLKSYYYSDGTLELDAYRTYLSQDTVHTCEYECDPNYMTDLECQEETGNTKSYWNTDACDCVEPCDINTSGSAFIRIFDSGSECASSQWNSSADPSWIYSGYTDMICGCPDPISGSTRLYGNPPICLPPKILDTSTVPPLCVDCTTPNTNYPSKATNEDILFQWQEPDDFSSECTTIQGSVQERTIDCKKEYRCLKAEDKDKDRCRKQETGSYVSPTAGVFHEDIALVGTDINLHYQSEYLSNDTIAFGWSLNLHHTLDGDYLHLGGGRLLNIASVKSVENNNTTLSIGDKSYIFNENSLHILTKDNYTDKTLQTFTYNTNNYLTSITDAFSSVTTINRDVNDTVISITAPHGQLNLISVDTNGDLINISYEDASNYNFTYAQHLMISEIEPNGNEFLHEFDGNGRVTRVVDAEQGIWSFSNSANDTYNETVVNRASGDVITYRDYFLSDGSMVSKTIIASGDIISDSTSIDGTSRTTDKCGVITTTTYQAQKDPITNKSVPSSITTVMPSGLSKTTNYSQNYTFSGNTLVKKETTTQTNGATTSTARDYELSTMTITSPESRVSTITYNAETLLPTKMETESLDPVNYLYDELGRVTKIEQGFRKSEFSYDTRGNLESAIDATGTSTHYSYDEKERISTIVKPDGTTIAFTYDANGNMKQLHTPNTTINNFNYNGVNKESLWQTPSGYMTQYLFDKQRRLTQILRPSGKTENFTYADGRLVSIETDESNLTLAYSCADRVQSMSTSSGETLLFTYDGDLLTRLSHSGTLNQDIDIAYNSDFLPQSIGYAGFTQLLAYDRDGLLIQSGEAIIERNITYSYNEELNGTISDANLSGMEIRTSTDNYNGVSHYNIYGELDNSSLSINAKRVFSQSISHRDPTGRILSKTERIGSKTIKHNYTYDIAGRLTKSETTTGKIIIIPVFDGLVIPILTNKEQYIENYTYDNNGNRLQSTINETTTTASYTLDDNLEVYGDSTYRYDEDGYLIEKTTPNGITTYSYGTKGELISVTTPTNTIEYLHNANNQRVAKKVDGVITEKYLWRDLTTLLAIYNSDDILRTRFSYADNRVPYKMTHSSETYYLSYNHLGSLRAVTDSSGNIVKEVTYDSFGIILSDTNPSLDVPFGFAGGLYDIDTKLTRFGYRDYDAKTGKWTAKDPIRFSGGDANLYGYVLGDPVGFVDPEGLKWSLDRGYNIGFHYLIGGAHATYNYKTNSVTICGRIGLGFYLGAFAEGSVEYTSKEEPCENGSKDNFSYGAGANMAYNRRGAAAHLRGNSESIQVGLRGRKGIGIGMSGGADICYTIYFKN